MKLAHVLVACGVLALGGSPLVVRAADDADIKLRGAGKAREALTAMQLKPFDNGVWADLSNWTGGEAFKPADAEGKVVMIVTWASWYPVSHRAMRAAQTAYAQHKDQGLIVVGVHNPRGFEGAAANAKELGITFPFAEDKDGKFRAALKGEQDANVYFIDRAGQMRFAQVDAASITAAADMLVKETKEQAQNIPTKLAEKAAGTEKEKWLTRDPSGIAPGDWPTVEFKEVDEEVYKTVKWPYMVGKVEKDPIFDKIKNDPPKIANWPEEDWIPSTPKAKGKILVVYFMDPQNPNYLNVIPTMNRLSDLKGRDAVVVGSLFKIGASNMTDTQGSGADDDSKIKDRNKEMAASLRATRSINHYLNPTVLKAENLDFNGGGMIPRLAPTQQEVGLAVLMSTDMRIRWIGNPYDPDLKIALDKLIAVDPAVKERRKAEDAKAKK